MKKLQKIVQSTFYTLSISVSELQQARLIKTKNITDRYPFV